MRDCFNEPVEVGDLIAYGTNAGIRVGTIVGIRTGLDVWGPSKPGDPWTDNQAVSIRIDFAGSHKYFTGKRYTISNPEESKIYVVKKGGPVEE